MRFLVGSDKDGVVVLRVGENGRGMVLVEELLSGEERNEVAERVGEVSPDVLQEGEGSVDLEGTSEAVFGKQVDVAVDL